MSVKKILWPTDLSHRAAKALPLVQSLSQQYGASVHLLYVVDDVRRFDHFYGDANPAHIKGLQDAEFKAAESMLTHQCQKDLAGCPDYHYHLKKGDPAQEILKLAEEEQVDMIVMATHGAGMTEDHALFFGSVAEKVTKGSKVPVLTVPAA